MLVGAFAIAQIIATMIAMYLAPQHCYVHPSRLVQVLIGVNEVVRLGTISLRSRLS